MQAFAQFVLLCTLLSPSLSLPAKLDALAGEGYNYEAPSEPSGLYATPDEEQAPSVNDPVREDPPTTTTTTTTPPPPPVDAYLPPADAPEEVEQVPQPSNDPEPLRQDPPPPPPTDMKKMMGPFMPYDFNWGVEDQESGNLFSQNERTDGQVVTGGYRVLMPDGRTQVVEYEAGPETGFVASVRYE